MPQRNSAACDACRARKVKCVIASGQSRCSFCIELDVECTTIRPRQKRGPKNRYVQRLCAQLDGDTESTHVAKSFDLDMIGPSGIIHQVLTDWFDWIHPVAPILHRGLFEQQLADFRRAGSSPFEASSFSRSSSSWALPEMTESAKSFFLLVVSVCAATVVSLRRRSELYGGLTVNHCLALAEQFGLWSPNGTITLERTLTLYNFHSAVLHEYGIDAPLGYRISADCAISLRYLINRELDHMSFIDQQVLKRVYWLAFFAQCTCEMHGRQILVLRHAHEFASALTPRVLSDEQLLFNTEPTADVDLGMGPDYLFVWGLNALSKLFLVWQSSQAVSIQTMENLHAHITRAHQALDDLPIELEWQHRSDPASQKPGHFGCEVEKANLKVTQLHIRSELLEQMNTIAKAEQMLITPDAIIEERHRVVDELLDIMYRMPKEVFDANGYSIVPKIRDIGSALLDELRTGSHGRTLQASIDLDRILAKLNEIDQRPMSERPYL